MQSVVLGSIRIVFDLEEFFLERLVYYHLDYLPVIEQVVDVSLLYHLALLHESLIDEFGTAVEDKTEDAAVLHLFIRLIGFFQPLDYIVIKGKRAIKVTVDGCRRELGQLVELVHQIGRLDDTARQRLLDRLVWGEYAVVYVVATFDHHLQHKSAHLSRLAVLRSLVVGQSDIL